MAPAPASSLREGMEHGRAARVRDFKNGAAPLRASKSACPVEMSVGALHQGGIWGDRVVAGRPAIERINLGEAACHGEFEKCAGIVQAALLGGAVESAVASQNQGIGNGPVGGDRACGRGGLKEYKLVKAPSGVSLKDRAGAVGAAVLCRPIKITVCSPAPKRPPASRRRRWSRDRKS